MSDFVAWLKSCVETRRTSDGAGGAAGSGAAASSSQPTLGLPFSTPDFLRRRKGRPGLPERVYPRGIMAPKTLHIFLDCGRDLIPADSNGLSDPYVIFELNGKKEKSSVRDKTLNPAWGESFVFEVHDPAAEVLQIHVFDKDLMRSDDPIGQLDLRLDLCEGVEVERSFTLQGVPHGKIHMRLAISDPVAEAVEQQALNFFAKDKQYGKAEPPMEPLYAIVLDDWVVHKHNDRFDPEQYALSMAVVFVGDESKGHSKSRVRLGHFTMYAAPGAGRAPPFVGYKEESEETIDPLDLPWKQQQQVKHLFPELEKRRHDKYGPGPIIEKKKEGEAGKDGKERKTSKASKGKGA